MAISTYGELKAMLTAELQHQHWLPQYNNATILFETSTNRRLRVRQMEAVAVLTTAATGTVALPADYLLWRAVTWNGSRPFEEVDYVHPLYLDAGPTTLTQGPRIFTIIADNLTIRPIDTTTDIYHLHYFQKVPTIVGNDANSNWLLTSDPDAYLFGVLVELFALQRNREGAELYKARRDEAFVEIIRLSSLTTGATSPHARVSDEYF